MRPHESDLAQDADRRRATVPHPLTSPPDHVQTGTADPVQAGILALQRAAGNAAVARMLEETDHTHDADCGDHRTAPVQRSSVHEVLRSSGQPLQEPLRQEMEARLGADFSDVRMHTDSLASRSAAEVNARAYTSGSHIVVGEGGADKHTLAHELTHVIQQRQGPVAGTETSGGLSVSDPSDRFEREAEANAADVMRGPVPTAEPAPVPTPAAPEAAPVQRAADEETAPVQRTVTYQGQQLSLDQARKEVQNVQSAALTPAEVDGLRTLIENPDTQHTIDTDRELVRLLRSHLREDWGLTEDEVDVLDDYQGGAYKDWNKALRSGGVAEKYGVAGKTGTMIGALAKTAKTRQKVQRDLSFETRAQFDAFVSNFTQGEEYTAAQFESTSRRIGAELDLPGKAVYAVTMIIQAEGHHGGEMSSVLSTLERSEGETVFPPGAKFRVTSEPGRPSDDEQYTTTNPFRTSLEMTEIEELDKSKQQMPSFQDFRKAQNAALFGGASFGRPPTGGAGGAGRGRSMEI
ncbi:DUF4157 domain-containing protein [Streptomyces sp. AJS327]|uniref:eCIS core domain-containing protein n=1 Tax=Streptomyces sp. AJS327 TaxID=2545265 RepID=UPI0015DDAB92|nr:DUF4157 domain-containing protein [Streptomyces sp. AJS327]MBA0052417.1 DUF4157 domain-containing protein [Streptomyces sp. AJS327]